MIEEPASHFADRVVDVPRSPVRADDLARLAAPDRLDTDEEQKPNPEYDPRSSVRVEAPHQTPHVELLAIGACLKQDVEEDRGNQDCDEGNCLNPDKEGDRDREERGKLAEGRGPLEHQHDRKNREEKGRIERVLRHQRARVDHRWNGHRKDGNDEGQQGVQQTPSQEVCGNRGERHHHRVDRLRSGVGVRKVVEDRVRRGNEHRIDEAVGCRRLVANRQPTRLGKALGQFRVDDFVNENPWGRRPA